ncbi:hypothetical protein DPMN_084675 [Dreissena polymorpha]|uniref:Uncharacterized protein n=1 Tax=Dreissena polymorpha TaxID=45954 RepID=A0A9D3YDK6_DREPO|nr:hypothetical protein DPMN_084675 [Dreissena polymorpha]
MANVKVFFGRTDRLIDTDGQFNCYMPPYRGASKLFFGGVGWGAWGMVWTESIVVCQRGIQAYYKNGVLYQRQTSADNITFACARRRLCQDKAMEVANASTPSVSSAEQQVD